MSVPKVKIDLIFPMYKNLTSQKLLIPTKKYRSKVQ